MAAQPLIHPRFRALDANGDPLSGGLLYSYKAGTTTPLATYTTRAGDVANANPVVLDANGEADVWTAGGTLYKFVLRDSAGVLQWTADNVPSTADSLAFALGDGSVSAPALAFTNDIDTGLYRPAADQMAAVAGGAQVVLFTATGATFAKPVLAPDGAVGAPGIAFASDPDNGFYRIGTNQWALVVGGAVLATFTAGQAVFAGTTGVPLNSSVTSGTAVQGAATSGTGGNFSSTSGTALKAAGNATKAALNLATQNEPSAPAAGDVYSDGNGLRVGTGAGLFVPAGAGICISAEGGTGGNIAPSEDNLFSAAPLPGGSLGASSLVTLQASGTIINTANAKTLRVYFGSEVISVSMPTSTAADWIATVDVIKTGTDAQRYVARVDVINQGTNAVTSHVEQGTLTEDESADISTRVTGESSSSDDIIQNTHTLTVK